MMRAVPLLALLLAACASSPDEARRERADRAYRRGVVHLEAPVPRAEAARAELEAAIELDPAHYQAWCGLAACHYLRGDLAAEARAYARAIDVAPEHLPAWVGLATARLALGDRQGARAAYRRVLELEPRHATAAHELGLIEADLRDRPPPGPAAPSPGQDEGG